MIRARDRIAFERVSMEFPTVAGPLRVVEDVSYRIRDGEFVSIIGPSGCGKTTTMNLVAGFVKPTKGSVLLDDAPVTGPGPDRGVIFQEYGVFPWLTVRQNIAFGLNLRAGRLPARERDAICERYMRLMGLTDFADAWPKTLSGGMRQRLAIARAYAVRPHFLLMDEPFGALDAQTREVMHDLIQYVYHLEKSTIVFVTHDVEEAIYLGQRVVVLAPRPGRIDSIYDVPLPAQRFQDMKLSAEFIRLKREILERIRETSGMKTDLELLEKLCGQLKA